MSLTKRHYEEVIQGEENLPDDTDWQYQEDQILEKAAEEAQMENIYRLTGTYPF